MGDTQQLYYVFVIRLKRIEFHVSADQEEVKKHEALCRAIGTDAPDADLKEWMDKCMGEVKTFKMKILGI